MLIESITFKLAVDFFTILYKNKIEVSSIKLNVFDGKLRRHLYFESYNDIKSYFNSKYKFNELCKLGKLVTISDFKAESNLYNFNTKYTIINVCDDYSIYSGKDFDIKRTSTMSQQLSTQYTKLVDTINKYKKHCLILKGIYGTGIYSPCYAESGWSEGTGKLKYYKDILLNLSNVNIFELN